MKNTENAAETKELTTSEHLALEVLKQEHEKSKAKDRGVITLGVLTGLSILGIIGTAVFMSNINHQNDKEWRELFSSYDYITQDGGGYNNVNSGQQGDLNNGATGENE